MLIRLKYDITLFFYRFYDIYISNDWPDMYQNWKQN